MHESADSGIEEFHGEKRLSTDSMWFEEEIHLDQPPPLQATLAPFQTNRVLFSKRTSCPAVTALHSKPLKQTLPYNVREAFKGYVVCEDTKQMKEPQRLTRSESLFCGSGSQVFPISSSSYAWAEGKQKSRKKVLQERSCKWGHLDEDNMSFFDFEFFPFIERNFSSHVSVLKNMLKYENHL